MTLGLAYWILMLIWLAFGIWSTDWKQPKAAGSDGFLFILLLLLGWKVFGPPIHS